jgi:hypothetical protein
MVICVSSLTFFRRDWQSAWIAIFNHFVFVCRLYLSIGEDAWLQPKRDDNSPCILQPCLFTIVNVFPTVNALWGSEMVMRYNLMS